MSGECEKVKHIGRRERTGFRIGLKILSQVQDRRHFLRLVHWVRLERIVLDSNEHD